jgi:glutamate/tyrosine decarboxylase-like PLP-dependent enzyme
MSLDDRYDKALSAAARYAAAFRSGLDQRAQRPRHNYDQALSAFDEPTPKQGSDAVAVVESLVERAMPGLHAMAGRRFFGWVIGASHPVGVAADWLTAAWGQNAGNHTASPAAAAAEAVAARWLLDILGLPASASVGFVTGATVANFVCLAAARGEVLRRAEWSIEEDGLFGAPPVQVLVGDDAHTTVFSALQYLGFGDRSLIRIMTDEQGSMIPAAFAGSLAKVSGPVIAITQAGQINTGAFDPHPAIIAAARRHPNCWVHVDGAFGLWARACPDRVALACGVEEADSWATDGHKWLQTPYDCGYAIVREAQAHRRAMTIAASYLPPVAEGQRDPSHFVPELSRRARGFATWALLKHLGREGVAAMVERHCRLARLMADDLSSEPGVAVLNDVVLNQVIVRFGADQPDTVGDDLTLRTIKAIQEDGTLFAGGARWRGRWVMRLSVIGGETTEDDVRLSAATIKNVWGCVRHA